MVPFQETGCQVVGVRGQAGCAAVGMGDMERPPGTGPVGPVSVVTCTRAQLRDGGSMWCGGLSVENSCQGEDPWVGSSGCPQHHVSLCGPCWESGGVIWQAGLRSLPACTCVHVFCL